ncbi:cysteine hydrolase family protein [Sulfitobacter sp. JB4-11]|uniref:cysteine hydrolase family protein n=1 Tax=Sulfitobacter rhodophyticola TaxID=3238304 RepID=UPI003D81C2F3
MSQPSEDYVKEFNADRITEPARSALIIVDMQYATGHRTGALAQRMAAEGNTITDWRFDRIDALVIPNTQRLIKAMRVVGGKVIYVTIGAALSDCSDAPVHMRAFFQSVGNYEGQRAHQIINELAPEPGDPIVRKTSIGAFASTGLDHLLRSLDREHLFLTGVSTNMCVETTAREAADRGYAVTLVEDACATTHKELHEGTMRNFARFFGKVRSTEDVIDLLS